MYAIILCGGSGTRLWPLSRKNFPKQFLKLYSDASLLQETYRRMREIMPHDHIFFVGNQDNFFNILNQIREIEPGFKEDHIFVEPKSLNTAPAIAYAVKQLADKHGVGPNEPIIFLPADHYIGNPEGYLTCVKNALSKVGNTIGTIGIIPTSAHTGYGYIHKGEKKKDYFLSRGFKEKPDRETAEKYLTSGEYLWNSGMYLFNTKTFFAEIRKHTPEIAVLLDSKDTKTLEEKFETLPSISIDYALAERSDNVVVFEGDFGWNDIGSFDSLAETIGDQDDSATSRRISIDSQNVFTHTSTGRLVATIGVQDLVIIDSSDSILVHKRGFGEDVKKIVDHLKAKKMKEAEHNITGYRPWGKYEVLMETPTYKVKKITVYPGAKLSLQSHHHRAEHWVVVRGVASAINGDKEIILNENESTFIPKNTRHRLMNPGKMNLELVEVQTGNYLEEDDIMRYDDEYRRK